MKTIRTRVGMGRLKASLRGLCLPVWLLLLLGRVEATTITIDLENCWGCWRYYSVAVYAGDTVVWVNPGWPTNYVESYGGEWKSGPLRPGDQFSLTLTNPGFFAYRTVDTSMAGTVTVLAWTGAPPAVAINTPVDGATVPWQGGTWVQASATNTADLVSIEFYANSDFIGVATNSPYMVGWGTGLQAQYILTAKATDREGKVTWSPPVRVNGGPSNGVWGPRRLPTGEMLFFYNTLPFESANYLAASDSPSFPRSVCSPGGYTNTYLLRVTQPGVFVDESVRGGAVPRRFYDVILGGTCP
jgi:hypothetical protein